MELDHILAIVNIFANAAIGVSLAAFYILLYGHHDSIVHKWPIVQHWSIKIGLVMSVACSFWNAMHVVVRSIMPKESGSTVIDFVNTPPGEILMNVGLAIIFTWAVYFHKYHFLEAMAKVKKTVRTKTTPKTKAKTTNGRSKLPPRSRN